MWAVCLCHAGLHYFIVVWIEEHLWDAFSDGCFHGNAFYLPWSSLCYGNRHLTDISTMGLVAY